MSINEHVPLSSLTTIKVGGKARFVCECKSVDDVTTALVFARERGLSWYVLGSGSNVLPCDEGYEGVIVRMMMDGIMFGDTTAGRVEVVADAGVEWDIFVQHTVDRGLWGLENLAGIPGTVGAAPVQNIGAYGIEVSDTLSWLEALNTSTNKLQTFSTDDCQFGYRESRFKRDTSFIITRVAFVLHKNGTPNVSYKDLALRKEQGSVLDTPSDIADIVRDIRSQKFPDLALCGTAGSFFKNPTITKEAYEQLLTIYPDLPGFPAGNTVKVSLAWILDHVLALKGFSKNHVRLFERQPLVLVTESGATAHEVDALADHIAQRVYNETSITIEREVRTLIVS